VWVTGGEQAAMQRVLGTCPRQRVPVEGRPPTRVQPTATKAPPETLVSKQ